VKRLVATTALATILAVTASVNAAAPGAPLTLEDALALARKNNHSLFAERARLAEAQTGVEQAWSALFPTVAGQGKYTRNYKGIAPLTFLGKTLTLQSANQWDFGVTATAPILVPAAYSALDAVKSGVQASEATFQASESDLLVGVARAFLAAAVSDEVLVARRSSIGVAQQTLQFAQTRQSVGTVTKVDVDRAELALLQAQQQEREATNGRAQAYRALGTLIGVDGTFTIQPEIPTATPPDANDVGMALHLRPEFRAIEATVKSAEAQSKARAWQWSPSLSAFGNARKWYNYDNFTGDRYAWAVGGQLDWVLFDGGTRDAQRHAASAQALQAEARLDVLRENIRDDLANSDGTLRTKKQGLETAERSVALSREALELARVQYESGVGTQLDLLQAQDAVVGAMVGLAQAHFDVAAADLALRHAAGTFPPK
jgi:multidrug efflux system outer membrane protein